MSRRAMCENLFPGGNWMLASGATLSARHPKYETLSPYAVMSLPSRKRRPLCCSGA